MLLGLFHPVTIGDSDTPPREVLFDFKQAGNGGQDRCCNSGCVARVSPGKREKVAKIRKESKATEIYFEEDSSVLHQAEYSKIQKFLSTVSQDSSITLVGYTDGCGGWKYNQNLSMRRAKRVKQKILSINPSANVSLLAAGEISHNHDPKNRKVHLTLSTNVEVYEPPPVIIADVYLIDSSGSIPETKFELYRRAITYHRPSGSRIYIATTVCNSDKKSFDAISPVGDTEIWFAYWYILDKMKPGEKLMIISDFDSRYPLSDREKIVIEKKVRERKVTVRIISI
jgi:outer membrane protein OmpA-like peptidoglycan-associated protein